MAEQLKAVSVDKDRSPVDAVQPTDQQRALLLRVMNESTQHAWSQGHGDFCFEGYAKYRYFCAYKTKDRKKGIGTAAFGFERKRNGLFMVVPAEVAEPLNLATPWTQKAIPKRKKVLIDDVPTASFADYLVNLAVESIEYAY